MEDLVLFIQTERDIYSHGFGHVLAWVGTKDPDSCYPLRISRIANWDSPLRKFAFDGLQARCQMDTTNEEPYAWNTVYRNTGSIDSALVERMARTLKKVERSLHKQYVTDGNAANFGQYVARFAKAWGIREALINRQPHRGEEWYSVSIGEAVQTVNRMCDAELDRLQPQRVAA